MWSLAIKIILTQIGVFALITALWNSCALKTKKVLSKKRYIVGSVIWSISFLLVVSTAGLISAIVVATTTLWISILWLKYKNYTYNRNQNSVILKQTNIVKF